MPKRILIVDDSASMRQMVEFTLSHENYEIITAVDGIDALDKAKSSKFDLFLVDVNMPRMDGITLIAELRKLSKFQFTPILVLTTESQATKKMDGKKAGATGWIVKPFKPDMLLKTIKKVLPI